MAFQKFVPTVEELEPRTDDNKATKRWKVDAINRRRGKDVVFQFHCPVDGCLYGLDSERHFSCIKYLKQHYKKVHSARTFVCGRCGSGHTIRSDLTAHEAVCGTTYECSSCPMTFVTKEALLTHAKRKEHPLPEEHRPKNKPPTTKGVQDHHEPTAARSVQVPVLLTVDVINCPPAAASASTKPAATRTSIGSTSRPGPRCILPKPGAPLNTVPLPTVAVMALSELSTVAKTLCISASTQSDHTQTLLMCRACGSSAGSVASRQDSGIQCHDVMPSAAPGSYTKDAWTQTARAAIKKQTTSSRSSASRSYHFQKPYRSSRKITQPQDLLLSVVPTAQVHAASAVYSDEFCSWPSKLCQTYDLDDDDDDLMDVDVVSSGTQTSPRSSSQRKRQRTNNPVSCDRFLDSPLRDFLAAEISKSSTSVQISTQTTSDDVDVLESMINPTYEQLLSNMETQTSDLNFFSEELSGLYCDIQTQTTGVDDGGPAGSPAQLTDMETQTFLSFLETASTAAVETL